MRASDSRVPKLRARITTVDPSQKLIQVEAADGPKQLVVNEVPGGFTWPIEGEIWSIYKENLNWILGSKIQDGNDARRIESLRPGQSLDPKYFEIRVPAGTTSMVVNHNLGSKALSVTARAAMTGYTGVLNGDLSDSQTSIPFIESIPSGGGLRYGSGLAKIGHEIVTFSGSSTAGATGALTGVVRGKFGTFAESHPRDAKITIFDDVSIIAQGGGGGGAPPVVATQYHHVQSVPANSWVITHNLNRYPNVKVVDSMGNLVEGDVKYNSSNQVTTSFEAGGFSGHAYLD